MASNGLGNLLSFNKMISEQIIKIVYYVGLIGIAFIFLRNLYESVTSGFAAFLPILAMSTVAVILSVLLWRVFCESIIILFRIYSRLGDINKTLGGTNKEAPIPGDKALKEVREAALKAKAAAAEKAKALKSSISKDGDDAEPLEMDLKPAAAKPATKPAPRKRATAANKKPAATAKKAPAKKTAAKKTTTARKKPAAKKPATKK